MKKLLLVLAVLFGAATASYAQTTVDTLSKADSIRASHYPALMSIGLDFGKTTGQTNKNYSTAFGASMKFELPFSDKFHLTAGVGIGSYSTKNTPALDTMQNGHFIPIEIGLKYFVVKNIYLEGDVGESLNINSSYFGYQSEFIYSPAVGVSIPIQKNTAAIDMSLRYESRLDNYENINQVALRVAYKFKL